MGNCVVWGFFSAAVLIAMADATLGNLSVACGEGRAIDIVQH